MVLFHLVLGLIVGAASALGVPSVPQHLLPGFVQAKPEGLPCKNYLATLNTRQRRNLPAIKAFKTIFALMTNGDTAADKKLKKSFHVLQNMWSLNTATISHHDFVKLATCIFNPQTQRTVYMELVAKDFFEAIKEPFASKLEGDGVMKRVDHNGDNLLHLAVRTENVQMVQHIMNLAGHDTLKALEARNNEGNTPRDLAMTFGKRGDILDALQARHEVENMANDVGEYSDSDLALHSAPQVASQQTHGGRFGGVSSQPASGVGSQQINGGPFGGSAPSSQPASGFSGVGSQLNRGGSFGSQPASGFPGVGSQQNHGGPFGSQPASGFPGVGSQQNQPFAGSAPSSQPASGFPGVGSQQNQPFAGSAPSSQPASGFLGVGSQQNQPFAGSAPSSQPASGFPGVGSRAPATPGSRAPGSFNPSGVSSLMHSGPNSRHPGGVSSMGPGNVASMPSNVASMGPGNVASMPSNVASMPSNVASMPGNVASMPGNVASMGRGNVASKIASMGPGGSAPSEGINSMTLPPLGGTGDVSETGGTGVASLSPAAAASQMAAMGGNSQIQHHALPYDVQQSLHRVAHHISNMGDAASSASSHLQKMGEGLGENNHPNVASQPSFDIKSLDSLGAGGEGSRSASGIDSAPKEPGIMNSILALFHITKKKE